MILQEQIIFLKREGTALDDNGGDDDVIDEIEKNEPDEYDEMNGVKGAFISGSKKRAMRSKNVSL